MKAAKNSLKNRILASLYRCGDAVYDRLFTSRLPKQRLITLSTVIFMFAANNLFAATTVTASDALNYMYYIIIGLGILFTLIMGTAAGIAFSRDSTSAKAMVIGTLMIPILFGIAIYIFKTVTDVSLSKKESL